MNVSKSMDFKKLICINSIEQWMQLDFIKDIRIQTYDKAEGETYFNFVLEANVITDGTNK